MRASYDAIYDIRELEDITLPRDDSSANKKNDDIDNESLSIKEIYLDIYLSDIDIRIGKQIVRWGLLEGSRIIDELNPLDFYEFIFRDVEDRYIPLWMVKGDYYTDRYSIEGIWIPELRFHKPAPKGSEFEEFELPPDIKRPPIKLRNSEFALKWSGDIDGLEVESAYLYTWDDFPAAFRSVFGLATDLEDINFSPRYTRIHIIGGTLSKSVGGMVIGGETSYIIGKFFATKPEIGNKGFNELKRDYIKYGMIVNYNLYDIELSFQFYQQLIINYEQSILQKRIENVLSLFTRYELFYNRLLMQLFILYFTNNQESLYRPRINYKVTDNHLLSIGIDIFEGKDGKIETEDFRFIGFFNKNDRIYIEWKYSF